MSEYHVRTDKKTGMLSTQVKSMLESLGYELHRRGSFYYIDLGPCDQERIARELNCCVTSDWCVEPHTLTIENLDL